jgi:hypothetical protein
MIDGDGLSVSERNLRSYYRCGAVLGAFLLTTFSGFFLVSAEGYSEGLEKWDSLTIGQQRDIMYGYPVVMAVESLIALVGSIFLFSSLNSLGDLKSRVKDRQ